MKDLTHERCSELLEAYVSGTLDAHERAEVDHHLGSCDGCAGELTGLLALQAVEVTPMTGHERDALSTAVRAAVFTPPKRSLTDRLGRRMAPALGAVALIAIAMVTVVSVSDDGPVPAAQHGGADEVAEEEATTQDAYDSDASEPRSAPAGKAKEQLSAGAGGMGDAVGGSTTESSAAMTAEDSTLGSRSSFTIEERSFARAGLDLGQLVPSRVPSRRAVDLLAAGAPDERLARLVRECTEVTVTTSPYPVVPASVAYYRDDVLVIGFVWVEETTATLNYELRGWVGGRCDQVSPIYRRGLLE